LDSSKSSDLWIDIDDTPEPTHYSHENRVCYLLLQVHIPSNEYPSPTLQFSESVKSAKIAGKKLGITILPLRLIINKHETNGIFKYVFRYPRYKRNDSDALITAESFLLGLSFTFGPYMEPHETEFIFRFPAELIQGDMIYMEDLILYEESQPYPERSIEFPALALSRSFSTSSYSMNAAWKLAPIIRRNENIRQAAKYLSESQENFYVWPGGMDSAIEQSDYVPKSSYEQAKFENALHNAFKAIEAIIGDPSKDDNKLFMKLREINLDPREELGLEKLPLYKIIRNMNRARDKKSAHGSISKKNISVGEMLDYQSCAHYVLYEAFEKELGGNIY
jgi:hypothetical protein